MDKTKIIAIILVAVLAVSIGFNAFLGVQSQSTEKTKLEMNTILSQAQTAVDMQIQQMGNSLIYASQQLSSTGISGEVARPILAALAANSTFIIDAATQDLTGTMIAVEPSAYRSSEGKNVGKSTWLNTNPDGPITPTMTPTIPLVEGSTGVALIAPVFDANKQLIGTLSVIFDPANLLNQTLIPILQGKNYEFIAIQTDGQTLYDSNPAKQPTNILTDPAFASQTDLLVLTQHIAAEYAGYGTYSTSRGHEVYWNTLVEYGQQWRLTLVHTL